MDIVEQLMLLTNARLQRQWNPDKTYLETAEEDFKKRCNNHTKNFQTPTVCQ